ncbi:MAG: hypothetical protein Kow00108_16320 [Calditrichia bacterium]
MIGTRIRTRIERRYLQSLYAAINCIYKTDKPYLLTFDDGPTPGLTEKIIDILKERNIQAVFFLLGKQIPELSPDLSLYRENNQLVGFHGYDHTPVNIGNTLDIWQRYLSDIYLKFDYIRPPYGLFDSAFLKFSRKINIPIMMWSMTTYDYRAKNPKRWAVDIAVNIKPGDVLLLHDSPKTKIFHPDALQYLLDYLDKK